MHPQEYKTTNSQLLGIEIDIEIVFSRGLGEFIAG